MRQAFTIGKHTFEASSMLDATVYAIHRARELMNSGQRTEGKVLYDEAWRIRDELHLEYLAELSRSEGAASWDPRKFAMLA